MEQKNETKKTANKKMYVIAAVVLVAVFVAAPCVFFARKSIMANTMRLLRIEGTVNVEDSKGGSKPVVDNVRFKSGDALSTGSDGLASVGLDDAKIVTLKNDSRTEFVKNGKQLELKLTKGALFFNVTEKLKADEKFEIKTSTMTAGIRGTSGIIYYDENAGGKESLLVTDGVVELSATNPDTEETKTATVRAGQKAMLTIHPGRIEDSVEFDIDEITEEDLSGFTLERLTESDALMDKVCNHTGWNKNKLKDLFKDAGNKKTKPSESASSSRSTSDSLPPETKDTDSPTDTSPVATPTRKPRKKPTKRPTRRPTKRPTKKATTKRRSTSKNNGSEIGST